MKPPYSRCVRCKGKFKTDKALFAHKCIPGAEGIIATYVGIYSKNRPEATEEPPKMAVVKE